jgi:hypothetical protein
MSIRRGGGYNTIQEFEREEIGRSKAGWSLDDLYQEATYKAGDESADAGDAQELDFDV